MDHTGLEQGQQVWTTAHGVMCLLSLPCNGLGMGKQGSNEAYMTPLTPSAELLRAGLPRISWAQPSLTAHPNAFPSSMTLPLSLPTRVSSRVIPPRHSGGWRFQQRPLPELLYWPRGIFHQSPQSLAAYPGPHKCLFSD